MTNPLTALFAELGVMLQPVTDAVTDRDALEFHFYRHGWSVDIADDLFNDLISASNLAAAVVTFRSELERLDADDSGGEHDVTALLDASSAVFEIIEHFPDTDVSRFPEPIADREAWADFAHDLVGALVADYLAARVPKLYAVLVAIGVVENRVAEAQPPFRREHQVHRLQWSRLAEFLGDPEDQLRRTYRWGDPAGFDHPRLLAALAGIARSWGFEADARLGVARDSAARFAGEDVGPLTTEPSLRVVLMKLNDFEGESFGALGFDVVPVTPTSSDPADGVLLGPVIDVGGRQQVDLTRSLRLMLTAGAELGANAGVVMRPGETRWNAGLGGAALQLDLASNDEQPRFLFGSPSTAHVSITGLHARARLATSGDDVDAEIVVGVTGAGAHRGLHVRVQLDEADGLIRGIVGSDALDLRGAVELGWSNRSGFRFVAGGAIGVDLPIRGELGPITLLPGRAEVSFAAAGSGASGALRLTAGIRAIAGPIEVTATGLGLEIVGRQGSPRLADHDDPPLLLLGEIGLDLGFVPPSGVGLRLVGGVVSGGGFLEVDRPRGRYAGLLQISVGGFALNSFGVIDTVDRENHPLPAPGYSIVIAMSATFPAVQLGLGFTLRGIGGLVGIHRDSDYDALRAGLTTGALDSVMFPPPGTTDRVIRDMESLFPVKAGRHVVGPMVFLGWGTPPIADIKVGVLFLFGGPFRVYLLGQLTVRLPAGGDDVAPVLLLKLDVVGELNPAGGSLSLDASLRDSSIAGYALTGDMAARVRWNDDPTFAIAFGGFHPDYAVEASFPALRRLAMTISRGSSLRIVAESYLAVTANTVQFGARAELLASKSGFSVNGWLEFHALFAMSPFSFMAAVGFDVSLRFKGRTFASVGLTFELSGPTPWRAKGQLRIKIFFVTFRPGFNVSWGSEKALTSPPRPVWPELEAALSDTANWASVMPPASSRDIIVAPLSEAGLLRVHPHGSIEIRQSVVPFNIELRRFGAAPPVGDNVFSLPVLRLGGAAAPTASVDEPFAPAQFLELTEDERLSRPSFERMSAGIRTGAVGIVDDDASRRGLTVEHETDLLQPDTVRRPPSRLGPIVGLPGNSRVDRMSMVSRTRSTTQAGSQFRHRSRAPALSFRPERFAIMETVTGTTGELTVGSATEAHQAIRRARAAGEARPSPLLVVAVSELS